MSKNRPKLATDYKIHRKEEEKTSQDSIQQSSNQQKGNNFLLFPGLEFHDILMIYNIRATIWLTWPFTRTPDKYQLHCIL
jgi:hypothetical protein